MTTPALVSLVQPLYQGMLKERHVSINSARQERMHILGGLLEHVVAVPAGDGDERNSLGVVTDLLDEGGRLLDDFVETVLGPLKQELVY